MRGFVRTMLEAAGSGLAGAITVALLNESLRRRSLNVPRLQITGMRAVRKAAREGRFGKPSRKVQYGTALGAGMLDATMYYSLVRIGSYPRPVRRGVMLGGFAGLCAIYLPPSLGLGSAPVRLTNRMKALTMSYYVGGGLVAGLVGRSFAKMRAMTRHPVKSTKIRWQHPPKTKETEVRQTEEARF